MTLRALPQVYSFEGIVPVIDPSAFVHPSAVLIGDVIVGPGCYVGAGAVLRGDFGRIVMERESNLQDNCIVHSGPRLDCTMRERAHIGHGVVLHYCTVERDALVGISAVVMDRAIVGEQAIVAAMSFVRIGQEIAPRTMVAGVPARMLREVSAADLAFKKQGTDLYVELARRCLGGMSAVQPLTRPEQDRGRTNWSF
ncbi:MAG: phenylacetic acid degradation protein PaaY [Burkholderiaceae bacterium]|nr:phenylacetic acid degradation protein PaaY [Burkholderiaceae bacterium]